MWKAIDDSAEDCTLISEVPEKILKTVIEDKSDSKELEIQKVHMQEDTGPQPIEIKSSSESQAKRLSYGGSLLPGEGKAIAQYAQKNLRIPRRGEIGKTTEEIEKLESLGYVMSGDRNFVMNAVRERKENQVIKEEGRRKMIHEKIEQRKLKEEKLIESFKQMIHRQQQQ